MQLGEDLIASTEANSNASPLTVALTERDRDIQSMVRRSLDRKDVLLAYQPVVSAADPSRIAYFEGLIRVLDDAGRIIPASDFIESCDQTETGRILDCIALELGLAALSEAPNLRLAINMSTRSIGDSGWMESLHGGLEGQSTIAERLIIEIDESSTIGNPEATRAFIEEMQPLGIGFALDDFGAGYMAFRNLRDFDFDIIKIAGEFVRGIHMDPDSKVIATALVSIAKQFDMLTVAECVGSEADANLLASIGVDCMQGYYFGVPTTRPTWPEFPAMLKRAL